MTKIRVTLSTIASYTLVVDTDDQEYALDQAYDGARAFGATAWARRTGESTDMNEAWEYENPTVEVVDE